MHKKLRVPAAMLGVVGMLLASSGAASAAGGPAPTLLSPNHKSVSPGAIPLVVKVPVSPLHKEVFIAITPAKKRDKFGHLKECFSTTRCDFVAARQRQGNKYSYAAPFNFPGYWSVTPGRYYWQAHYYTLSNSYYSRIGSFVVK